MRAIIVLVSVIAILLALAMAALGPGTRMGLWDYGAALGWMRDYLAKPVLVAAGASAIAFLLSMMRARDLVPLSLAALLASGAAGYVPLKMRSLATSNPFIHDITTDFENPPEIFAAALEPRKNPAEYVGHEEIVRDTEMTVAEAQRESFPDIEPLLVAAPIDRVTEAAREAIMDMKMDVLLEGPVGEGEDAGWRIEAVQTSFWYGFKDDFVVRLMPTDGGGTRVDVRSKSRVGLSDLGMNAQRVRDFMARLEAAL